MIDGDDRRETGVVAKVQAVGSKSFHMDLPLLEKRFQFFGAFGNWGPNLQ